MKLNLNTLDEKEFWASAGVTLPNYPVKEMVKTTKDNPTWVHFGAGNIFRAYIAQLQQRLLNEEKVKGGIIAVETFDYDILDKIFMPYDNITMLVLMNPNGKLDKKIIASIADGIKGDCDNREEFEKLKTIFRNPSLQMVSFTITEKGYALKNLENAYFPVIEQDIKNGPDKAKHVMSFVSTLLYERYRNGMYPISVVSMDNCSHNGERLMNSIVTIAKEWEKEGFVDSGFVHYLEDETKVGFPWSMIDKITPRPAEEVKKSLSDLGIEDMNPIITSKNTYIAPFVNAEVPQYLVMEDKFPNGRPPLEDAGVFLTDRDTVNNTERMKVTTCLNPLHTALAVFGCLLDYTSIAEEMKDSELKKLVEKIGYEEGMPVVVDPGIIKPKDFIREVIEIRLPNPYIPDMPQRIATDTSQKVAIRFGETIKSYMTREDLDVTKLKYIPLVLAGWCRYLLGVNDKGEIMDLSSDPMLPMLTEKLAGIKLGDKDSYQGNLKQILNNQLLFAVDLYEVGLGDKIESYFMEFITGPGAVRATLQKYL